MKWLPSGWKLSALLMALLLVSPGRAANRVIRVEGMTVAPGQTNSVRVVLESLGNEKALGFNLAYNPAVLIFVRAVAGVDSVAVGAGLTTNPNQATNFGRLGLTLSLDLFSAATYLAGTNFIAEVFFTPIAGVTSGVSAITFTNEPGITEVSDPQAGALPATYLGSSVSVGLNCGFLLGTNAAYFSDTAGSGSVNLLASNQVCAWTVVNTNPWIYITSATNGTGSATMEFLVSANPDVTNRTGTVVIAGKSFTVTQQGVTCSYTLAPGNRAAGAVTETNTFDVLAASPCAWSVNNTNSWISILSGGSGAGTGTVTYVVADNFPAPSRVGTLTVAGQTFVITQAGFTCAYALLPVSGTHAADAATNSFSITTTNFCPWSVSSTNSWITILVGGSNGNGTVTYAVSANPSLTGRTGVLVVGGEIFSVTQQAMVCSYALAPTNRLHTSGAATDTISVTVTAPCPWSAVNTNPWISLVSGSNGAGSGTITYSLGANPTSLARTGTLVVADQTFLIMQAGISCSYFISPTRRTHGFGATSNFFTVQALAGCLWTVVNTNPWINFVSPGTGNGTNAVGYLVEANFAPADRIGFLTVEGATLIITQRATTCTYGISPTNFVHGSSGGTGTVNIATGSSCTWNAITTNAWIVFTSATNGTASGAVGYSLLANFSATARTGAVSVAGQTLPVTQAAYAGGFVFSSIHASGPGEVSLSITGGPIGVWELQISGDLSNWSRLTGLTNATGRVDFTTPAPGSNQFYRAIRP